ncbi:MAG: PEP-CTERM sorting domain-containing protein [Stigonema ocellatum SAG 48.90 = DSM 106950]|nr:PEP-CTERM sorting domain-containing protein [Stigonema ocellatum SAG 48.90 = DSM 106950]
MKTKFFSVLAAATTLAGVVATTGSANAATLSSTASVDYALTDTDSFLNVQQFDSSLGQLNSVTIDFASDLVGDARFTNTGAKARYVTVNVGAEITLDLNDQNLFDLTANKIYGPYYAPTLKQNPNQPIIVPGLTTSVDGTQTFTNSDFLQLFTGTNTVGLLFTAVANSYISGGGNLDAHIDTQARASVNVTYDYTVAIAPKRRKVPEPSALLGVGLVAGFGLLSQRNRSFSKA